MTTDLPGTPGPKLRDAWTAMNPNMQAAFRPHLVGGTSADYLADWLTRAGTPVSASTIRTYRRTLNPDRSVTDE